jgi:hypothetical protein
MFWSLRLSYLCFEVWGCHIYILKFEVVIFMFQSLRSSYLCLETTSNFKTKYDDLKLPSINMMTSCFKTSIWWPQAARHKYDNLKLPNINMMTSNFQEVWVRHIYVMKFEVVILMSWSLRLSYLYLEVWGRHIHDICQSFLLWMQ